MPDTATTTSRQRRRLPVALLTVWGARVAWLAVAIIGGRAVGGAAADRSEAVQTVATVGSWIAWGLGAVALAVPSVIALTAARVLVPASLAVAAATAAGGADAPDVIALAAPALVATMLVGSAETGRTFVQASAYGDERRFGLRPPIGYLTATVVSWGVWVMAVITTPLAWAARSWALAVVATVIAVAATLVLPRRWHQLSRRWLVAVPAGLVVHDPVVLAETLMLPRRHVTAIAAGSSDRDALDLSGPTPGLAVEITLDRMTTAVLAPRPSEPRGRVVELRALLVSPTRPGAVLAEAVRRRLPVR